MAFNVQPLQISQPQAYSGGVDWSPLTKLGEQYKEGVKQDKLADLGKKLANGEITYQQAAGQVAELGDSNSMLKFLALSEQEKQRGRALQASQNFSSTLSGTPSASETISGPPSAAPRISVAPNPADDEPAPTRVAALPPPTTVAPPAANAPIRVNPDGSIAGNLTAPTEPPPVAPPPVAAPPRVAAPPPQSFNDRFSASRPQGAAPSGMLSGEGPTIKDVPRLLSAIANPDLPDAQKEIAKDLYKRAMDSAKPTEKLATLQGLKDRPDLLEIEKELRKSQKTDVNILPGEKKQDEKMGEYFAKAQADYYDQAKGARTTKGTLDVMERATQAPGYYSGAAAPAVQKAQQMGVALGLVDADKAAPAELFSKMSNKLVTDVAGGGGSGLGAGVSNADRDFIQGTVPNISNTPAGNKQIIGVMRLVEDRKLDVAKEVARYAKDHNGKVDLGLQDHLEKWSNEHPLDFDKVPGLRTIAPTSQGKHKDIEFKVNP
jgi:hypothetical protein